MSAARAGSRERSRRAAQRAVDTARPTAVRIVRRTVTTHLGMSAYDMTVEDEIATDRPLHPHGFDHRSQNAAPRSARGRR